MNNLLLILVCLGLGLLLQRFPRLPKNSPAALNFYVIYLALPAVILHEIPRLELDQRALLPFISAWLIMAVTAALIWITARVLRWSRSVTGAMMLVIPLGNTSFVGLPLIQALLPPEALAYALLYDQTGTVVALNTYALVAAAHYTGERRSWSSLVKTLGTFPPFVALLLALASLPWTLPSWLDFVTGRIGQSMVPVVIVAVGMQWQLKLDREHLSPMLVGLGYKLLLIPALVFGLFAYWGLDSLAAQAVILQSAMPAMISAGVVAIAHGLAPRLVSSCLGYGLLLSLVTVPLWSRLL